MVCVSSVNQGVLCIHVCECLCVLLRDDVKTTWLNSVEGVDPKSFEFL